MSTYVFTIGHSVHPIEHFLELLRRHGIDTVIDVRSVPFSARIPHFNKPALSHTLKQAGIRYAHFAEEFGARRTDPALLDEAGRVDFDRVRQTKTFREGVERVLAGARQGYRIALMCSEAEPFDCHRFVMVSYQFTKEGATVLHVLRNGDVVENRDLERKLLDRYHNDVGQTSLFDAAASASAPIEDAYRLRAREIAFINQGDEQWEVDE